MSKATTPQPSPMGANLNFMDAINMVRQRWKVGFAVGILVASIVAYLQLNQPEKYRSSATMVVEFNPDKLLQLNEVMAGGEKPQIYDQIIFGYLERLKSRSMSELVVENMTSKQLEVIQNAYPEAPTYTTLDGRELPKVAGSLRGAIRTQWRSNVQVVAITAVHGNPKVAKVIVEAYCDTFIALQSSRMQERQGQVLNFLEEQSEGLQSRLEQGEAQLQEYRNENDLVSIEGNLGILTQKIGQLSGALTSRQIEIIAARNQLEQIDSAQGVEELVRINSIASRGRVTETMGSLDNLRNQRKILSETLGRRHPTMLENQASIQTMQSALELAVASVVEEMRKDYAVLVTGYEELEKELGLAQNQALELDKLAIEYRVLQRKLDVQKSLFDAISQQFAATDISSQFDTASIRILDPPLAPRRPFEPDRQKAIILAGMLFLACFIAIPVGLEMMDNRLKTFSDVENFINKPVFGDVKHLKNQAEGDLAQGVRNEVEDVLESFRTIYSSITLLTDFKAPYSFLVTSSLPSEGKTFVACNLAETFARHRLRVLLIDCDLRRPNVHRQFNLSNDRGLLEWLRSDQPVPTHKDLLGDEALNISQVTDNFFVLPSGGTTKEPTGIFSDSRIDSLFSRLKGSFDILIFDTPPAGLFPDAVLIAPYGNQTLFVARQKQVTRQKARFAVNRFERTHSPVKGVVLNGIVDNTVASGYGSYREGYGYGYAYGYERDKEKYKKYYTKEH